MISIYEINQISIIFLDCFYVYIFLTFKPAPVTENTQTRIHSFKQVLKSVRSLQNLTVATRFITCPSFFVNAVRFLQNEKSPQNRLTSTFYNLRKTQSDVPSHGVDICAGADNLTVSLIFNNSIMF